MSNYPPYLLTSPIAADGDKVITPATAESAGTGRLSQEKGWTDINSTSIAAGGIPPYREDFNGVLYLLSQLLLWYQQGGVMTYTATLDYEAGNEVFYSGSKYRCLKANGPSSTVKAPTQSEYWSNLDTGVVRYDEAQSLTTAQKTQARDNILAVARTGDTMTGTLTAPALQVKTSNPANFAAFSTLSAKGTAPSSDMAARYRLHDNTGTASNSYALAGLDAAVTTDGTTSAKLVAFRPESGSTASAAVGIYYPSSGNPYSAAPTPADGDDSTKIATTEWVNDAISTGTSAKAVALATARTIRTNLASTTAASFDGTANITPGVTGILAIANGGTGNSTGLAASATKLATARTIQTNLSSTSAASFNGTANVTPGVTGTLAIANGGTGSTTASAAVTALGAVAKAGDTMTGTLTVPKLVSDASSASNYVSMPTYASLTKGGTPTTNEWAGLSLGTQSSVTNATTLARVALLYGTTYNGAQLQAFANTADATSSSRLGIYYDYSTGSYYTYAPTPSSGDSSTKIATTAFVKNAVSDVEDEVSTLSDTVSNIAGCIVRTIDVGDSYTAEASGSHLTVTVNSMIYFSADRNETIARDYTVTVGGSTAGTITVNWTFARSGSKGHGRSLTFAGTGHLSVSKTISKGAVISVTGGDFSSGTILSDFAMIVISD